MAVDEVLWNEAAAGGKCCWRFYRWSEPTLSLGYFQRYEERLSHPASRDCAVVRRLSGGGAILHDAELTYSLVLPARHPLAAKRLHLYRAVHGALIEALGRFGLRASLYGDNQSSRPKPTGCGRRDRKETGSPVPPAAAGGLEGASMHHTPPSTLNFQPSTPSQPFLCFQRRSEGDVVAAGVKIGGSAQRRSRGAVLQHGSVLLGRSAAAPELPSIADLTSAPPNNDQLIAAWREMLQRRLGLVFEPHSLGEIRRAACVKLADNKYAADRWTINRGRLCHPGRGG
jgi:lipoate-protein ligase A